MTGRLRATSVVVLAVAVAATAAGLLPLDAAHATTPGAPSRVVPAPAIAAAARPTAAAADARIAAGLRLRIRDPRIGRAVGVYVWDVAAGRAVFQQNRTTAYLPASTMKIVTAAVALQTMPPDTRFPTVVRMAALPGGPSGGPVTSTPPTPRTPTPTTPTPSPPSAPVTARLTVVAGGDPLTTSAELRALAQQTAASVTAAGASRAELRLDDSLFPAPTPGPGWTAGYQPYVVRPVRPLVRDGRLGADVAAEAASYLAAALTAAGVPTAYRGRGIAGTGATTVGMLRGHTVVQAVRAMLLPSDNQVAEMLFRLSARARGRTPTWTNASLTAREVLRELKVPLAGVVLSDGSGVSRTDRLTAYALVTLLRRSLDPANPALHPLYRDRLLPVAGRTGTLAGRFSAAPSRCARGLVVAKTGTLHDVVSLAGFTPGADGGLRVFAFVVNRYPLRYDKSAVRRALDELAATVTGCY